MHRLGIGRISYYKRITSQMAKKTRKHVTIGDNETLNKVNEPNNAPENWELLYGNILEMRKEKNAPVDTMGCEKIQDMEVDPKVGIVNYNRLKMLPI